MTPFTAYFNLSLASLNYAILTRHRWAQLTNYHGSLIFKITAKKRNWLLTSIRTFRRAVRKSLIHGLTRSPVLSGLAYYWKFSTKCLIFILDSFIYLLLLLLLLLLLYSLFLFCFCFSVYSVIRYTDLYIQQHSLIISYSLSRNTFFRNAQFNVIDAGIVKFMT